MATTAETLEQALKLHQQGALGEAERLYREVLADDARSADAWHLLGLIEHARGKFKAALEHIGRAIELDNAQPSFHNHLGEVYRSLGRLPEAETCCRNAVGLDSRYAIGHNTLGAILAEQGKLEDAAASYRQAITLKPDFVQAQVNLALALESLGQRDAAIAAFRQALTLDPGLTQAHHHLGTLLHAQSRWDEAIACYRRALTLEPEHTAAHCNLGSALEEQGRFAEAVECFERALRFDPNLAQAHFSLGVIHQSQGRAAQAVESYQSAIRAKPGYAEAFSNLGTVFKSQGKLSEALACYERALECQPDSAEVLNNMGNVFKIEGRVSEAIVCYERTVRIKPEYAQAHCNLALARLAEGDFAEGWAGFEWRWRCPDLPKHRFGEAQWDGSPLDGRTLLVHAEQGLGDTLQFIRYLQLAAGRGGTVIAEVQYPLLALLAQSGFGGLFAKGAAPSGFDLHVPLMSLPRVFGTTLENVPHDVPYLKADPRLAAHWRTALGEPGRFRVGIAWQGNPAHRSDRFRSIPLAHFAPLAQPGVELVSLQNGPGSEQLADVAGQFAVRDLGDNVDREHGPFMDTAAIMTQLDLVVTSDTAIAHLAGALGVKVWVALPLAPDWRWLYDREDSPWYPTMRLFRQQSFDDWPPVFARIAAELRRRVQSRHE